MSASPAHPMSDALASGVYIRDEHLQVWRRPDVAAFAYSDGDEVEQRIARHVAGSRDVSLFSDELRKAQVDWPSTYHLSATRANLLQPFRAYFHGRSVLEIGAGCGAITRFLGEAGARVTAVEGSLRRASIAASRCRDLPAVDVVCERFGDLPSLGGFDVITLIGVLEYARLFGEEEDPVGAMLARARSMLNADGVLLVAIENQLGLKYFAGAPEDHVGRAMAGVQDQYSRAGVVTFGRDELAGRIQAAGFGTVDFALPFPDYKLPGFVAMPAGYARADGFDVAALASQAIAADPQLPRHTLFSLSAAVEVVARNRLLADLSNSFLVAASNTAGSAFERMAPKLLGAHYSTGRPGGLAVEARFEQDDGVKVRRALLAPDRAPPPMQLIRHRVVDESYIPGSHWGERFERIVERPGWSLDEIVEWLAVWRDAVASHAQLRASGLEPDTRLPADMFDALPRNLVVTDTSASFFDLEWLLQPPLTFGLLFARSLAVAFDHARHVAMPEDPQLLHLPTLIRAAGRRLGLVLPAHAIAEADDLEAMLQDEIHGLVRAAPALEAAAARQVRPAPDVSALLADWDGATARIEERDARIRELSVRLEEHEVDLARVQSELAGKHQHVDQLEQAVGARDAAVAALQAELDRATHARDAALAESAEAAQAYRAAIAALRSDVEAAAREREVAVTDLQRTVERLSQQAEATDAGLAAALADADGLRARLVEMADCTREITTQRDLAQHALHEKDAEIMRLWAELATAESVSNAYMEELRRVTSSRSWAVTSPLRRASGAARALVAEMRRGSGRLAERAYRSLPVAPATRLRIKGWVFRHAAPLFRHTRAYQRWLVWERMTSFAPPAHASAASQPAATGAALVPANSLPAADGHWEWMEHAALRARIDAEYRRQRDDLAPRARSLIDFAGRDPGDAAASIDLPSVPPHPDVTILVPVYNHLATTLECLASIAAHVDGDTPSFEILVADDASTDGTPEVLARIPGVQVVSQPTNLGFLRNCNAAAGKARGRTLLLLNNDVQVTSGWLRGLLNCLESSSDIGAVGPRIVYPNGRLQEAGAALDRTGTAQMVGLWEDPRQPAFAYSRDVDYCSGACLLLRTADFRALGGFDECYAPAYCEDSDLCMRLRAAGRRIVYCADAEIVHHLSLTSDELRKDYKLACIGKNLQTFTARWQEHLDELDRVRTIAFYLPQFHPIPENDLWWGRGFTEWTNVSKARPNFVGHDQPRQPADLGYYDLRLPEIMRQQAALARRYGLSGFCFYYYWFDGHRLLERPIENLLQQGGIDFPFCLCWANENWTRRWDGQEQEVLMAQRHSPDDDLAVIRDLMRYMAHPDYIRIDGRPLLLIYRVGLFPDFKATAQRWREACRREGLGEIYLALVESFELTSVGATPQQFGCDAAVEFPPHGMGEPYPPRTPLLNPDFQGTTADYRDLATRFALRAHPAYKRFSGVMPGWDNTARRQNHSYVFENATPGAFQAWLETTLQRTRHQHHGDERIVFINAWNEWAEGAYLEPDRRFGHTYLEALRNALDSAHLVRRASYALGD